MIRNKGVLWMIVSVVVVFAAGAVSGIFIDKLLLTERHGQGRRNGPPSIEMMARDLGLSTDQQSRIKAIFEQSEVRFRELRANVHQSLGQIREEIKNQIDLVLTPEQKTKFEAMIHEHGAPRARQTSGRRNDNREQSPPRED